MWAQMKKVKTLSTLPRTITTRG